MIIPFIAIMAIILIMTYQVGLDRLVLRFYMSLTTGSLFSTSSPSNISQGNFRQCLLVTPGPFRTTCATSFRAHPATAGRVPATDAGCGLSTPGHWDGPAICNEWKRGCRHSATCSAAWRKVPCEHANSPYLGPATVQYLWPVPLPLGSSGCASVG